jgi:molybdopterin molybdotransferase
VRISPGKAIGFGLFQDKPVFCLPGGPPSNHMAFIQLALPGLQRLGGDDSGPELPLVPAVMGETVSVRAIERNLSMEAKYGWIRSCFFSL